MLRRTRENNFFQIFPAARPERGPFRFLLFSLRSFLHFLHLLLEVMLEPLAKSFVDGLGDLF